MSASVQTIKVLRDHLQQLKEVELKTFNWYLFREEEDESQPVPKFQLGSVTCEDTVDKLVQMYEEEDAVQTAVDILFMMEQNGIASKLTEAGAARHVDVQLSSTACSSDGDDYYVLCQDLSCPVCFCTFTEPVTLRCGHSFCNSCIRQHCSRKVLPTCPLCLKIICGRNPPVNYALKSLSENYKRDRRQADPSRGGKHSDCIQSPSNVKKQEALGKIKRLCDSSIEYIKGQSRDAEKVIQDDFEKLHAFLRKEEGSRLAALREEEMQKICVMQKVGEMSKDLVSLSAGIKTVKDLCADVLFTQSYWTEMERTRNLVPGPQSLPQALIMVPNHVGNLQFKVWEKMMSIIKHTPVVLDPNTASPWLSLSDDLTKVEVTNTWQQRPGNLERNTSYPQVFGCQGFRSGKHRWEVAVGNRTRWMLGVAEEALDRKQEVWTTPHSGLWTIMKSKRRYKDIKGNTLPVEGRPNRIRVELAYENGTLSFHDADNDTAIFTYKTTFSQTLYPYFGFVEIDDDDEQDEEPGSENFIQICESTFLLTGI